MRIHGIYLINEAIMFGKWFHRAGTSLHSMRASSQEIGNQLIVDFNKSSQVK